MKRLAKSKRARKIRQGSEFSLPELLRALHHVRIMPAAYAWSLEEIMAARDDQMRGLFRRPARLSEAMRTDDALHVARKNRLAPQRDLAVELIAAPRGLAVAEEAAGLFGPDGIAITPPTTHDLAGYLADNGIAIGFNEWIPREDGSRVDVVHHAWPIEHVWWHEAAQTLMTYVVDERGSLVLEPIIHGNGRWVVYAGAEVTPWRQDAAILAGALVWAGHAFATRDWSKGSANAGNAKIVGELPPEIPLEVKDEDTGTAVASPDAEAFMALLQDLVSIDSPFGIKPSGAKVDVLASPGNPWEVFERLMLNRERAAARIYLGTDGTLGATGGAPGVDITSLFGVARTIVKGDLNALERGFLTGVIEPWAALNFGDSALAPARRYVVPEPDADAVRESFAKRNQAFLADVAAYRANGLVVDDGVLECLAKAHDVPVPSLPEAPAPMPAVAA